MSPLYIIWDLVETPESLLTIFYDSKESTIIPFVPRNVIYAVKTAQPSTESGEWLLSEE